MKDAVRVLGPVDNRELPSCYAAADLSLLPSLLAAFPTVAAEALACGTPIVSTDHPGGLELAELFPDDVGVIPRRDPTALADAIVSALKERGRTSPAALEKVEREFRTDAGVEVIEAQARLVHPPTFAAREGQVVLL